jgi:hypothetical protein
MTCTTEATTEAATAAATLAVPTTTACPTITAWTVKNKLTFLNHMLIFNLISSFCRSKNNLRCNKTNHNNIFLSFFCRE